MDKLTKLINEAGALGFRLLPHAMKGGWWAVVEKAPGPSNYYQYKISTGGPSELLVAGVNLRAKDGYKVVHWITEDRKSSISFSIPDVSPTGRLRSITTTTETWQGSARSVIMEKEAKAREE